MIAPNIIGITKFRTPEFLDCIDIYDNEFFIVIRRGEPFLIWFPIAILDEIRKELGYDEIMEINKREIQRGVFGKEDPWLGKIFILKEKWARKYAFVRYTPNKTYPTIANCFKNGKLFPDNMWDYYKPIIPPHEAKRVMTARFLARWEAGRVDRAFFTKNRAAILETTDIPEDILAKF